MQQEMQEQTPEEKDSGEIRIDLGEIFSFLLRKWWIWTLCLVLGVAGGFILGNAKKTTSYQTQATYVVDCGGGGSLAEAVSEQNRVSSLLGGCVTLARQNRFYKAVTAKYNEQNQGSLLTSYKTVEKALSVSYSTKEGNVVYLTVTSANKKLCLGIMNAATSIFADYIQENYKLTENASLQFSLANDIATEDELLPIVTSPVVRYMLIGGGAALVLSVLVLAIVVIADTRVRDEEELTEKYGIAVLSTIPDFYDKGLKKEGYYRV